MQDILTRLQLRLLHTAHIELGPEWQFDQVISPFCRLYLITSGEAWVFHHGQKFTLRPGNLYLIPSFSLSRYHCDAQMGQYYISFLEEMDGGLSIFDLLGFGYACAALPIDELLMQRLVVLNPGRGLDNIDPKVYDNQAGLLSFNQPTHGLPAKSVIETHGILLQLLSRFIQGSIAQSTAEIRGKAQWRAVLNYIHTHLHEKITMEELAALSRQHVDYFSREFQHKLGLRPTEYIINKRLEKAQLLMTTSSFSLQEIAEQVGIADIYYFSRLFKRRFGVPPGTYRKRNWPV